MLVEVASLSGKVNSSSAAASLTWFSRTCPTRAFAARASSSDCVSDSVAVSPGCGLSGRGGGGVGKEGSSSSIPASVSESAGVEKT